MEATENIFARFKFVPKPRDESDPCTFSNSNSCVQNVSRDSQQKNEEKDAFGDNEDMFTEDLKFDIFFDEDSEKFEESWHDSDKKLLAVEDKSGNPLDSTQILKSVNELEMRKADKENIPMENNGRKEVISAVDFDENPAFDFQDDEEEFQSICQKLDEANSEDGCNAKSPAPVPSSVVPLFENSVSSLQNKKCPSSPPSNQTLNRPCSQNYVKEENNFMLEDCVENLFEEDDCFNSNQIIPIMSSTPQIKYIQSSDLMNHLSCLDSPKSASTSNSLIIFNDSRTRKRKFPGPAGLLDDLPNKEHHLLLLKKSTSPSKSSFIHDQEVLSSQMSSEDFQKLPWQKMIKFLSTVYDSQMMKDFCINNMLQKARRKSLPKLVVAKILCVLLKRIQIEGQTADATFRDQTGEIEGEIDHKVLQLYFKYLQPGSVLVLKQTTILFNMLIVRQENLVVIYDSEGTDIVISDFSHEHDTSNLVCNVASTGKPENPESNSLPFEPIKTKDNEENDNDLFKVKVYPGTILYKIYITL